MQITNIEMKTTSTGKPYKSATMDGEVFGKDKFNVFSFHTRYDDVVVGRSFAPEEFEQDGQYIKLSDPDKGVKKGLGGRATFNAGVIIEQKNSNIRAAQDRKDESIKISSTARDATLILSVLLPSMNRDEVFNHDSWKQKWLEIRQWLLDNFDKEPTQEPPF